MLVVVMGVSGSGKTTLGDALAAALGWARLEGDAVHPAANIEKMRAGTPLTDADRTPWLAAIAAQMKSWNQEGISAVICCSALKRSYRDVLREADQKAFFVYLRCDPGTAAARLHHRPGHFMPASLVQSQFAILEAPTEVEGLLQLEAAGALDANIAAVLVHLRDRGAI